ncbi:MAG: hypothetical protein HGA36_04180 [Candidatus Moranbacteria bacterium]|nr:hypothetical protein [Candidatus Moranbacteria bacterium]
MEKTIKSLDPKRLAVDIVDHRIESDFDVQDRLGEGCGFFALVSKNPVGEMSISITAISPNNLKGETFH